VQIRGVKLTRIREDGEHEDEDFVAVEEPLHIRVCVDECETFAVIMRTPGDDEALSLGFLYSEGAINQFDDVRKVRKLGENEIEVWLRRRLDFKSRDLIVNSSCGVCGRTFLYIISTLKSDVSVSREVIFSLPEKLRESQKAFSITGGLHAAALFSLKGELIYLFEDVGRHNAVDKAVGRLLMDKRIPLNEGILQVSGRLGYEIVVKGIRAGIPIICGISAPTSLAIDLAEEAGVTLIGFLRGRSFNVYSHKERVK